MAKWNWFCSLVGKKKNFKGRDDSSNAVTGKNGTRTLRVQIERPVTSTEISELESTSFTVPVPFGVTGSSSCKVKLISHECPAREVEESAYEGEDEHDESLSMKRDFSDFDLQAHVGNSNEEQGHSKEGYLYELVDSDTKIDKDGEEGIEMAGSGHVSDPGIGKAEFWASPKLKRSCSNVEAREVLKKMADQFPLPKSQSFEELQKLAEKMEETPPGHHPLSPVSLVSHFSADKVMLKKHSSSQILPSRSRRLWWKLFLWSHRNLHRPWSTKLHQPLPAKLASNQQGGYSSDTLEPRRGPELGKPDESPLSIAGNSFSRNNDNENQSWDGFQAGVSGLLPQNQWVAFAAESSAFSRVDEWVKGLPNRPPLPVVNEDLTDDSNLLPSAQDYGISPTRSTYHVSRHPNMSLPEEILHANSVIQSLNSSSTVAHIAGIGLRVIPTISRFSSLRSVNLSGNHIVHISPGSLPKGLHTLDLSRNNIHTIEGLRELTRLRVLDLSYNRISRIGQGLSNCALIKELYLAGNKISDVEGLHRLLKLTILDLSFNKITTTKTLGQIVANYNSLLALNLVGNPIQSNISEEQLRKAVCSLLPKLAYLNKQAINPQKAREVATEVVVKAAIGNSSSSRTRSGSRRKAGAAGKRVNSASFGQSSSSSSRHKSRSRTTHHHTLQKTKATPLASSSH